MAGIPVIGPVLGAAAAASTFAAVEALGAMASAESGAVLPEDMLLLAHKNEMVLPSALSQRLQDMTNGGGPSSGGLSVSYNVAAMDGKSVSSFFSKNRKPIARQLQKLMRNGGFR